MLPSPRGHLKHYEIITLILVLVFGLLGAWLFETVGEYPALLICIPPPLAYYLYSVWRYEKPPTEP